VAAVVLLGAFGLVYLGLTAAAGVSESARLVGRLGLGRGSRRADRGR
jgi:hypothetical protein